MKKTRFVDAKEAVDIIKDGDTVRTIGMTLISACETILKEIEMSFLEEGNPRDLAYLHTCGQASIDQPYGKNHLRHLP